MKRFIAMLLVVVLLAGACGMSAAAENAKGGTIRLEESSGTVTVSNAGGKVQTIRESMRLYNGYSVVTGLSSEAFVSLDDSKAVKLDASTKVEVKQSGKQLEVALVSGQLFFDVTKPLKADETMNITTSTMVTGVRGSYGWVRPNEMGLMHGHVTLLCRNPYTGETRVTEVYSGERVYFDPDPQGGSADPELLEIDFVKEKITNADVPVIVVREMAKDQEGLCDPVIADVPTVDVPKLLEQLPEMEKAAAEQESAAREEMEKALKEEEASLTDDPVDPLYAAPVAVSDVIPEPPTPSTYLLTVPSGTGYSITNTSVDLDPVAGGYPVPAGEEFTFAVMPYGMHAVFADDIGPVSTLGDVSVVQEGSEVDCSVIVNGDGEITFSRIYTVTDALDQDVADTEPYIAVITQSISESVTIPSGSVLRVIEGETLTVTGMGVALTIEEGADLIVEGTLEVSPDSSLVNNSTHSVYVRSTGMITLEGSMTNNGRVLLEGSINGTEGGTFHNFGVLEIADGAAMEIASMYNGNAELYAHDDNAQTQVNGTLTTQMISNHGELLVSSTGTVTCSYTLLNCYRIINNGTFNNEGSFTNGDSSFDPDKGYGTFQNNGVFNNGHRLVNYSFNVINNQATINNTADCEINNSGEFENYGVIENNGYVSSVGELSGSGVVNGNQVDTTQKYTIRFDNNGGYGTSASDIFCAPGDFIDPDYAPSEEVLVNDGFTLDGWCTDRAGENEWEFRSDTVQNDMVLYAKWV